MKNWLQRARQKQEMVSLLAAYEAHMKRKNYREAKKLTDRIKILHASISPKQPKL